MVGKHQPQHNSSWGNTPRPAARVWLPCSLHIKGAEGEEAVLCSENRTFAIKAVETTNSVWLVQPDQVSG